MSELKSPLPDPEGLPAKKLADYELRRLLESALGRLPHKLRKRAGSAAHMRACGYEWAEVAEALGVDRRTVYRDRAALRVAVLAACEEIALDPEEVGIEGHVPNGSRRPKHEA